MSVVYSPTFGIRIENGISSRFKAVPLQKQNDLESQIKQYQSVHGEALDLTRFFRSIYEVVAGERLTEEPCTQQPEKHSRGLFTRLRDYMNSPMPGLNFSMDNRLYLLNFVDKEDGNNRYHRAHLLSLYAFHYNGLIAPSPSVLSNPHYDQAYTQFERIFRFATNTVLFRETLNLNIS